MSLYPSFGVVLIVAGCLGLLHGAAANGDSNRSVPDSEVILAVVKSLLNATLLPSRELPPDPTVLCALRLAPVHNLRMERAYLKRIQQRLREMGPEAGCSRRAQPQSESGPQQLTSGLLALMTLALRASCLPVKNLRLGWVRVDLLEVLDRLLDEERRSIALRGTPVTTYYQYALAVQSLCALNASVDPDASGKLSSWALLRAPGDEAHTLDTSSQALVALSCLWARADPAQRASGPLEAAALNLVGLLLGQRSGNGQIGNIYSTSLAVQALDAASSAGLDVGDWAAGGAAAGSRRRLFEAAVNGEFNSSPGALAQLLPSLVRASYLTVPAITCQGDDDSVKDLYSNLTLRPPPGNSTHTIMVTYTVSDGLFQTFNSTTTVALPQGSNLLAVLEAAQAQDAVNFSFATQASSFGPYLVEVNGLAANSTLRQYWSLMRAPDILLDKGLRDYIVSDGENLIANLTTW